MADFGEFGGPIKKFLGTVTVSAANGSNVSQEVTNPNQTGTFSDSSMVCVITTSGDVRLEIGGEADANSFLLTSSDRLVAKILSGSIIGTYGVSGTPTVTIKKMIS